MGTTIKCIFITIQFIKFIKRVYYNLKRGNIVKRREYIVRDFSIFLKLSKIRVIYNL